MRASEGQNRVGEKRLRAERFHQHGRSPASGTATLAYSGCPPLEHPSRAGDAEQVWPMAADEVFETLVERTYACLQGSRGRSNGEGGFAASTSRTFSVRRSLVNGLRMTGASGLELDASKNCCCLSTMVKPVM